MIHKENNYLNCVIPERFESEKSKLFVYNDMCPLNDMYSMNEFVEVMETSAVLCSWKA